MPMRDELEAMRARIDALERELSDTELDREKERLTLERELAEARLELARLREREHAPQGAPAPAEPKKGKAPRWTVLIPVVVIAIVIAGYLGSRPSFKGHLEVRSARDPLEFAPTVCLSGDGTRPEFFGALLRDARGNAVRIEPDHVTITRAGGGDPIEVVARQCDDFSVDVEWGSARVERVESVDGHAHLDCELEDGTLVRGSLEFETCSR